MKTIPKIMKAAVLDRFGGPEQLTCREIDVPEIGPDEVLIQVDYAGVGVWDAFEREGGYANMLQMNPRFPYVLGSEGSGTVVARGSRVTNVGLGDRVYATAFLNPNGGFYAEYAAVNAKCVLPVPDGLSMPEAAVIAGVGLTALRGLEDVLALRPGESVVIFGASGGIGHLAVQLAKCLGARVFAVASGEDGVAMVKRLGCDAAVNGKERNVCSSILALAPDGFDAALFTAGGETADALVGCIRKGGRIAYPYGIQPAPKETADVVTAGYHGEPDPDILGRLHRYIEKYKLRAHISHTFALEDAHQAHDALNRHYLGKICLKVLS